MQVLRGDSRDGRAHCQCLGGPERACPGPHETLGLIPKSPIAFSGRTFERVQTACAGVICALMYVAGTARKSAHFLTPGWSPSQTTPRPRPYRWRTDRRDFVAAGSHYDPLVLSERTHRFYKGHRDLTVGRRPGPGAWRLRRPGCRPRTSTARRSKLTHPSWVPPNSTSPPPHCRQTICHEDRSSSFSRQCMCLQWSRQVCIPVCRGPAQFMGPPACMFTSQVIAFRSP